MWHFSTEVSIARVLLNISNYTTYLLAFCSLFFIFYPSQRFSRDVLVKMVASLTTRVYIHREMRPKSYEGNTQCSGRVTYGLK